MPVSPRSLAALAVLASAQLAVMPQSIAGFSVMPTAAAQDDDDPWVRENKVKNLRALSKKITVDVEDQPFSDLVEFITGVTGVELEPIYQDDDTGALGIDPATEITIRATNSPAIVVLERIIARAERIEQIGEEYTWQFTETGSIQFGPKSELNRNQRVELYDISDLLFIVPNFNDPPEFDLSSALQSSQGGGGSSPFQSSNNDDEEIDEGERRQRVIDLIQNSIEPDQWAELGGDGAAITVYGNSLIITGPDYIHRQIGGYDFWPSRLQQVRQINGRRDVRIRPDSP